VVGTPVDVTVTSGDGSGPGTTARSGATVGGVDANGQDVAGVVTAGTSDGAGIASVTFTQTGWQRVKARQPGAIASNSLDVCVTATAAGTCAGTPPSQQPVVSPGDPHADDPPVYTGSGGVPSGATSQSVTGVAPPPAPTPQPPTTTPAAPAVRLTAAPRRRGRSASLAWTVTWPGSGIAGWTIAAREDGTTDPFAVKARGTTETAATLTLAAGHAYVLRLTVTDRDGRVSAPVDATVVVPTRKGLHWNGTTARVRLGAGRPAFVLRGSSPRARVEIRTGGTRRVVRVGALGRGATKTIAGRTSKHAATTTLHVLSGRVRLMGALVLR
jgi:hypothetical protein